MDKVAHLFKVGKYRGAIQVRLRAMHSIGKHGVVVLGEVNCARDLDEPDPLLLELKDGTSCAVTTVMTLCGDGESSAVIVVVPASCWTARISMRLVDPRMRRGLAYHGASIRSRECR